MSKPVIHLLSIAGSCRPLLECLKVRSYGGVVELAQRAVGDAYEVTASTALMNPRFDEHRGGRRDDADRGHDLQQALAEDGTAAIVTLRGGAWVTRLLADVDFDVLSRRRSHLHVFGFSEMTTVVNIVSVYPRVTAWYHHDAGFLEPGDEGYRAAFGRYFTEIAGIVEGNGPARTVTGRLVQGRLPRRQGIVVVGGCLQVLPALLGTRFEHCIDTTGKWLALEEVDDLYSIDRHLGHLKLAGALERCRGLLIGDVHFEDTGDRREDLTQGVLELLPYHLPADRETPVVAHCDFGHCRPAGSFPINRPITLARRTRGRRTEVRLLCEPTDPA